MTVDLPIVLPLTSLLAQGDFAPDLFGQGEWVPAGYRGVRIGSPSGYLGIRLGSPNFYKAPLVKDNK